MSTTITTTHCGQPAKPYAKVYGKPGRPHSIETGLRCVVCAEIRLPTGPLTDLRYMEAMPAIREDGIAFDESLNNHQTTNQK